MPQRHRPQPEIADVVALAHTLASDEQRTTAELAAREKRLAPMLSGNVEDRVATGLAWLDAIAREDAAIRAVHQRAETAVHLTGFILGLAGALLGWGATFGAFYFDGSGRVNAVLVLALLVVIPGLFILPFAIAALPAHVGQRMPGVRLVLTLSNALSPGRLAPLVWRIFPGNMRESMMLLSGRFGRHHQLYADLQKWAVLRWSQLFAVSFQVAALAACLVLVVFTDLAFGWSTTLTTGNAALDAQRVHRVTSAIATPWSWAIDDAAPSLALVEESRYFRVAAESVTPKQAARLGGWWRFVVLTIACYGLLPRLVTFAIARSRLRSASRAALVDTPGLSAVLRRIHRAEIQSIASQPEGAENAALSTSTTTEDAKPFASLSSTPVGAVINWAEVPLNAEVFAKHLPKAKVHSAGGTAAMADDVDVIERIAKVTGTTVASGILIVVKAWEPPLMEFVDFVTTLRAALPGKTAPIVILPVGLDSEVDGFAVATPAQLKLWRDKLGRMGDPYLRVASRFEEALA